MLLVDSHCHLADMKKGYTISQSVLPVSVGYSHESNCKTVEIAKKQGIPFVLGIAPQTAIKTGIDDLELWVEYILKNRPNAIGEIGLDYHWAKKDKDIENEKILFKRMLSIAREMNLPIVIHARDATSDVLDELQTAGLGKGFVMHFFSGTLEEAKRVVDLGGLLSFTPLHSKQRRTIIKSIDVEYILVETDAPYVGRTPEDVRQAVEYVSEVKEIDFDSVARKTSENAMRFFNIKHIQG